MSTQTDNQKSESPAGFTPSGGSEVGKCKCADCGKEIIYCTIQLCDDCYNYRSDTAAQDEDDNEVCDRCGGDGFIEYADAGPSEWGEDCPSEMNHLIPCPECRRREEVQKANPQNDQALRPARGNEKDEQ